MRGILDARGEELKGSGGVEPGRVGELSKFSGLLKKKEGNRILKEPIYVALALEVAASAEGELGQHASGHR